MCQQHQPISRIAWLASALEVGFHVDPVSTPTTASARERHREQAELEDEQPRNEMFAGLVERSRGTQAFRERDLRDLESLGDAPLEFVASERIREGRERSRAEEDRTRGRIWIDGNGEGRYLVRIMRKEIVWYISY